MGIDLSFEKKKEEGTLAIRICGRIDSTNAAEFKEYYDTQKKEETWQKLVADLQNLTYVSSAGLRVFLYIAKAEKDALKLTNVSREVYEIFEMTGFTEILNISRAMREVSVEGCPLIGQGGNGKVYRLGQDTIIKLYKPQVSVADITREREYAQKAFLKGVPTAISYDIVRCGESMGIVFEMINADTVSKHMAAHPEMLAEYTKGYAELVKTIHSIDVSNEGFLDEKQIYLDYVGRIAPFITEEEAMDCRRLIEGIPQRTTLIHGDLHPNNVMIQDKEMLLIDMADVGYGHPIFDLSGIYLTMVMMGQSMPAYAEKLLGITYDQSVEVWEMFLKLYFETDDEVLLKEKNDLIAAFALLKMTLRILVSPNMGEEQKRHGLETARKKLFPNIDRMIGAITF